MMKNRIGTDLKKKFTARFGEMKLMVQSPGRVNIIGEHTDYNEGFVLPGAINKAIFVAVSRRADDLVHLYSEEFHQDHAVHISELAPTEKQWPNYILGVADQLQKRGYQIGGFNLSIEGDVPIGSGLSSSAAVECATAYALNELFGLHIPKSELVLIAQKAEHEFARVLCGIMDQFASMFGKKDHVIRLDCRSLDYQYEPLKLDGYKLVLFNTNVKHSLASTEYNTRRKECTEGVKLVSAHVEDVHSLRDVTMGMLNQYVKPVDALIYKRCKYVVEENKRLLAACDALEKHDLATAGELMFATHEGLSSEYEVSCRELDFLVEAVRENEAVLGARMMGGGFGGCTINIIRESEIESLSEKLGELYQAEMKKELTVYIAETSDGTGMVN